jgi:hypothetical protein
MIQKDHRSERMDTGFSEFRIRVITIDMLMFAFSGIPVMLAMMMDPKMNPNFY